LLPLPLTTLIKQLRAAGFSLDPGREMQLRKVVHERGAEYIGRFGEMKYLLAPFVASRPKEQQDFYEFWDRFVADLETKWAGDQSQKIAEKPSSSAGWRWLLLPLLALLAYGALRYFYPEVLVPEGDSYVVRIGLPDDASDSAYKNYTRFTAGDTLRLTNQTQGRLSGEDSTGFQWRLENIQTDALLLSSSSFHFELARPLVQGERLRAVLIADHLGLKAESRADTMLIIVQCASPPAKPEIKVADGVIEINATHGFAVMNPEKGVVYNWDIGLLEMQGASVETDFVREGPYSVSVRAIRGSLDNIDLCYSESTIEVQVVAKGYGLPILASIPLVKDQVHTFASRSAAFKWGKWLAMLLLFLPYALWKYRQFNEARKEKTDEEIAEVYPIFDQGPYNVPYRSRNDQISVPADFFRIADQLRVREEAEVKVFDGAATIEATVNSGGFPTWRERNLHRPADYLVLVTHNDEFNQQDLLLKRLTDFLSSREAAITVYYHEGQFEHFWNKEYPKGWSPDRLYDRYQQFRLLVLGNAHGLVDTYASKEPRLRPNKAKWLNGWARRLVLTTEPSEDWTAQEVLLHRHALLYPITMLGLNEGIRMLNVTEEYEAEDFPKWRTLQQRTNPEPSARYRKWETVADHEDYLRKDPQLLRWFKCLAVTGNPDWNLTIAIGRALDIDVTHDRLLQLSRIPWLAGNRPDHDLRFALLARINPQDEAKARAAVIKELELVEDSVKGSFAQTEWQTNLAVHQLLIRAGLFTTDQLRELELAAQRKEQPEEQLQTKAGPPPPRPGSLDRLLAKDERAWKDTRSGKMVIGTITLATLLLLFIISQLTPERELAPGEAVPWWASLTVINDAALEANNAAVELWETTDASIKEDDGAISIENAAALGTIKSKLKEAWDLRDGGYPQAANNRWKASLNEEGYRLNAAYLDLAVDKEVAFRDLLEESGGIEWAGDTPENLFLSVEHQHGLKLFGLYQTLTEKYPLGQFGQIRQNQLKKEFPDLLFERSATRGFFSTKGKLPDGRDVREVRAERDSLLADAEGALRVIEDLSDGAFFDSLSLVMPVNLRTLVEALNAETPSEPPPIQDPVFQEQEQDRPDQIISGSEDKPDAFFEESEAILEARELMQRFSDFRYNQTLNFESTRGQDQSSFLYRMVSFFQKNKTGSVFTVVDNNTLSAGAGGVIRDGQWHNDNGLILLHGDAPVQEKSDKDFTASLSKNSFAVIITSDRGYQKDVPIANDLMLNARRLEAVFKSLDFEVTSLRSPSLMAIRRLIKELNSKNLNENSQLIIVLNQQVSDDGNILISKTIGKFEVFPTAVFQELAALQKKAGHSLRITNNLKIGRVDMSAPEVNLEDKNSEELLQIIQESGNVRALTSARSIIRQANDIESNINYIIESMVKRSGGYGKGTEPLYPQDKRAVEYEFIKGSAGFSVESQVTQYADALRRNYQNLKVPDAAERVAALKARFTAPSLYGKDWDVGTFTGKTLGEAIPILEEITTDVRGAEKAYLIALAESLN